MHLSSLNEHGASAHFQKTTSYYRCVVSRGQPFVSTSSRNTIENKANAIQSDDAKILVRFVPLPPSHACSPTHPRMHHGIHSLWYIRGTCAGILRQGATTQEQNGITRPSHSTPTRTLFSPGRVSPCLLRIYTLGSPSAILGKSLLGSSHGRCHLAISIFALFLTTARLAASRDIH